MPPHSTEESNIQEQQSSKLNEEICNLKETFKNEKKIANDDSLDGGSKGSIQLSLGSYKSFLPFFVYLGLLQVYYMSAFSGEQEFNIPISRKPMMQNQTYIFILTVLYVSFALYWGPLIMKNRKPIKLKKLMIFYNLFQVCICSYIFVRAGQIMWFHCLGLTDYDPALRDKPCYFRCEPEDRSDSPYNNKVADFVYLYFLTKMLDWCDTIFFVLQKKWSHISVLHVFHHMGMFYGVWWFAKYVGSGHYTFAGFVNAFVHVVLYLYYFLALLGPSVRKYLWWKKYLTMLQLSQFVIAMFFVPLGMYNNCGLNNHIQFNGLVYAVVFLYLFGDFYRTEYKKKPQSKLTANKSEKSSKKEDDGDSSESSGIEIDVSSQNRNHISKVNISSSNETVVKERRNTKL